MANPRTFTKNYKSPSELVSLLQSRGLFVEDTLKAEHYLSNISYYRLSAYMCPLLKQPKSANQYKSGASFSQVMMLYRFDKKLRLLLFNEIEKIEIAVRTAIIDECAKATNNPFWMTDSANFSDISRFNNTLSLISHEVNRSHEEFINHFKQTYQEPFPPAWMLMEILPLGMVNAIYSNLKSPQIKKSVSKRFGLQPPVFNSWMAILTVTRNSCCHHSRVWNKQNPLVPLVPKKVSNPWISLPSNSVRIYYNICIIKYFIDRVSPNNDMKSKVDMLLASFPNIDTLAMGFPAGWSNEPLWSHN